MPIQCRVSETTTDVSVNMAEEWVQLVDQWNRPVGTCPRSVMRQNKLLHRACYVLVIDDQQRVCVQKRSLNKDYCPGWWDLAAGGVLNPGESFLAGAQRELQEELGIHADIVFLREFYTEGEDGGRAFGQLFVCRWQGAIQAQAEEIDWVEWWTADDIQQHRNAVTPDSLLAWQIFCQQPQYAAIHAQQTWQFGEQRFLCQQVIEDEHGETMALLCAENGHCEWVSTQTVQAMCWRHQQLAPLFSAPTSAPTVQTSTSFRAQR